MLHGDHDGVVTVGNRSAGQAVALCAQHDGKARLGAAALGMDAVLLSPSCCDPLCRRAVRVSMGTVFQVPWATLGDSPADWPEAGMARLHA